MSKAARTVIFDVDGTLSDVSHRLHFITKEDAKPDWDSFFLSASNDDLIVTTADILRMFSRSGYHIELWTGRASEVAGIDTERMLTQWLKYHRITYDELRMREPKDRTEDAHLKRKWLHEFIERRGVRPACVFEDRASVCDMWRAEGVQCYQVAKGDF